MDYKSGDLLCNDKYEVTSDTPKLGGMSKLIEAFDHRENMKCIIKYPDWTNNPENKCKRYLENEIEFYKIISKYKHPNFVNFYGSFLNQGLNHLVLEYIEGNTLNRIIKERWKQRNPFSEDDIKRIIEAALKGLSFIHDLGYIFRDFHSGQMMMGKNNKGKVCIKIIDLGTVKQINESRKGAQILGEKTYMPPEFENKTGYIPMYPYTDVIKVGYLYKQLILSPNIKPNSEEASIKNIQYDPKFRNHLQYIKKSTALNPKDRYICAKEFLFDFYNLRRLVFGFPHCGVKKTLYQNKILVGTDTTNDIRVYDPSEHIKNQHLIISNIPGKPVSITRQFDAELFKFVHEEAKWISIKEKTVKIKQLVVSDDQYPSLWCLGPIIKEIPYFPMSIET